MALDYVFIVEYYGVYSHPLFVIFFFQLPFFQKLSIFSLSNNVRYNTLQDIPSPCAGYSQVFKWIPLNLQVSSFPLLKQLYLKIHIWTLKNYVLFQMFMLKWFLGWKKFLLLYSECWKMAHIYRKITFDGTNIIGTHVPIGLFSTKISRILSSDGLFPPSLSNMGA